MNQRIIRILFLSLLCTMTVFVMEAASLVQGRIYLKDGRIIECAEKDRIKLPKHSQDIKLLRRAFYKDKSKEVYRFEEIDSIVCWHAASPEHLRKFIPVPKAGWLWVYMETSYIGAYVYSQKGYGIDNNGGIEVLVKLSLDLVMLPFMLMSWLFKGWPIFPNGGQTIKGMIDDVIKATAGIAMVGVFLTFSIMFLNAVFGQWDGADRLALALSENDSSILMDGLMMRNDSIITILLMGIFIAMFMTMIPALVKTLFAKVKIPEDFYNTAKKDVNIMWGNLKKWYASLKK